MLVGGFFRGQGFLTLPAKFAGPATPHRQLQRYLERLAAWVSRPQAVVDRPLYQVAATTCRAITKHPTLPGIAPIHIDALQHSTLSTFSQ